MLSLQIFDYSQYTARNLMAAVHVNQHRRPRARAGHGPCDAVVRDVQRRGPPRYQVLRAAHEVGHNRPLSGWMTRPDA